MRASVRPALLVTVVAALALPARAEEVVVPPTLQPWVPWVLYGTGEQRCPLLPSGTRTCLWPGPLTLSVDEQRGTFEQRWTVLLSADVPLPGDGERWPQEVTVDGKRAVVLDHGGPHVRLPAGDHVVAGRFLWDVQPERLLIPATTALLSLSVRGRDVAFPRREGAELFVDRGRDATETVRQDDRLEVAVFRKVVDDAPLLVETRLVLDVAGKAREVTVPGALLAGFEPAAVGGPVPVRVEGAAVRAQVRPGSHVITVVGRSARPDAPLVAPPAWDDGPPEEIWVYAAMPALRIAHVEGPPSVAADQTRLPAEWRSLPAWRLLPGETMKLVEDRRGDVEAAPAQLTLQRELWLDFDGSGYTAHDVVRGAFAADRLEMGPDTTLGRATVDGRDAFLTSLAGGRPGIEVRSRQLDVVADSRIAGGGTLPTGGRTLPAVSWAHDFQTARVSLHLPPGYRLLHAGGVDEVSDAWLKRWSLFEIFFVVVLTAAALQLWGPLFAVIAGSAFVLTFQERDAPTVSWVVVVVLAGIHRAVAGALPAHVGHPAMRALAGLRVFAGIVVAALVLGFAVQQVRLGMHPSLAVHGGGMQRGFAERSMYAKSAAPPPEAAPAPAPPQAQDEELPVAQLLDAVGAASMGEGGGSSTGVPAKAAPRKAARKYAAVDPDAVVQTGPGLPRWQYETIELAFSGPVRADQTITLWLTTPTQNLLLAFVRVGLLLLLVLAALGLPGRRWPAALGARFRGPGALWAGVVSALLLWPAGPAAAQTPDDATLQQLRTRLLSPPACGERCVEIASLEGEATATSLRLSFEVHAGADVAVPLPGDDDQWTPRTVVVDGRIADAARVDGRLWVRVPAGVHVVVAEGPLPPRASVQIALPRAPRRGTLRATGWTVDGVHADGSVDDNLQLARVGGDDGGGDDAARGDDTLPPSVLPPFLLVERRVQLGLAFEVETRVVRGSPAGTPIVVDVPLLPGENVTTDGVRAETRDGRGVVKVNLGPADTETAWRGTLSQTAALTLVAPVDVPWLESWIIEDSPLWHVTRAGIPPIHDVTGDPGRRGTTTWRPWPGEQLTLSLARPAGVAGQTLTIDAVTLTSTPGLRSTDVQLAMTVRSSRGAQHPVRLPDGAELLRSTIRGATVPLRADDGVVTLPLSPGASDVVLAVRLPSGVATATRTPVFDVGADASNVELTLALPDDRWILLCGGPRVGPAVLFWSFLVVMVIAAAALGRAPTSPLRPHEWVLLSLGLTQVDVGVSGAVAGWLLLLGWRRLPRWAEPGRTRNLVFNAFQATLVVATLVGLGGLVAAIRGGLLGAPDMQVQGDGSWGTHLRWLADRTSSTLPVATAWSLPVGAYRAAMLAWSFWLVRALLRWLRDGFAAFGAGGFLRRPFLSWPGFLRIVPGWPRSRTTATTATTAATAPATTTEQTPPTTTTEQTPPTTTTSLRVPEAPPGAPTSAAAGTALVGDGAATEDDTTTEMTKTTDAPGT